MDGCKHPVISARPRMAASFWFCRCRLRAKLAGRWRGAFAGIGPLPLGPQKT
jgi:hypothetical protein